MNNHIIQSVSKEATFIYGFIYLFTEQNRFTERCFWEIQKNVKIHAALRDWRKLVGNSMVEIAKWRVDFVNKGGIDIAPS